MIEELGVLDDFKQKPLQQDHAIKSGAFGKVVSSVIEDTDGKIYSVDAATGSLCWKTHLGAPVITSAAVSEDGFYICDFAGNIYYYRASYYNLPY